MSASSSTGSPRATTASAASRALSGWCAIKAAPRRCPRSILEHYPGMTEKKLAEIEAEANRRWPLSASLIIHRYGRLEPGDRIVLVATASPHREAALAACHFLIDWLKTEAPFWKSEETPEGERWVAARAEDDEATRRWRQK